MTFPGFSCPYTNPECDNHVRLSKSDKNIGAGVWRVVTLFETADLDDVFAHPRITNVQILGRSIVAERLVVIKTINSKQCFRLNRSAAQSILQLCFKI